MKVRSAAGRCSGGTVPAMQWIALPPIATVVSSACLNTDVPVALAPRHGAEPGIARPGADEGVDAKLGQAVLVDFGLERRGA